MRNLKMGWNHKTEMTGWIFILIFPIIAGLMGIFVPFIHNYPILFWILTVFFLIMGFIIVVKRTGSKK
jgi:putative Ca2+/H+ antiporter (TMEM165/GDT1 family)